VLRRWLDLLAVADYLARELLGMQAEGSPESKGNRTRQMSQRDMSQHYVNSTTGQPPDDNDREYMPCARIAYVKKNQDSRNKTFLDVLLRHL
jgi:hypothetical protein